MTSRSDISKCLKEGEIIRHAERDELDEVLDLLRLAFPQVPRHYFESIVVDDPEYDPRYSLVIEHNEKFVSHLQIFARSVMIDGDRVRFGGIGSVGTPPAYRRRGYATVLLRHAIAFMQEEGFEGSLLFTGIQGFYAKLGWMSIHRRLIELPLPGIAPESSSRVSVVKMEQKHLRRVSSLADSFHPDATGRIVREPGHWLRPRLWLFEDERWVVLRNDCVVGFFCCRPWTEQAMLVSEFAYDDQQLTPADFFAMLHRIAYRGEWRRILGNFLFDSGLHTYLEQSTLAYQEQIDSCMMWRDLGESSHYKQLERSAQEGSFLFWETDAF